VRPTPCHAVGTSLSVSSRDEIAYRTSQARLRNRAWTSLERRPVSDPEGAILVTV